MTPLARGLALAGLALSFGLQAYSSRELDRLPMLTTDAATVAEQIARHGEEPRRFAVSLPVNEALTLRPGEGLRIFSAGAAGVAFNAAGMTPGARLRWASVDDQVVHDLEANEEGALWAPPVPGETGVLTVADTTTVTLELVAVQHSYRSSYGAKAAGDSGSCNIDVACSTGDNWRDQIRSTVLLFIDNMFACTGSLVNNTANNNTPLVLTANHCEITNSNAGTVIAVFNFQRPLCNGVQSGPSNQTINGAGFVARSVEADTTLIRLNSTPPSTFNVHLAGWDARSGPVPQNGVSIHHPSADNKKISVYDAPAVAQNNVQISDFTADSWRVQWAQGTTEQGSSGGGLWNQDRAIVGVLSGGNAGCDSPLGFDFFGRLDRAWSTSSALRLALDPVGGGTQQTSCGRDPGDAACAGSPTPTPTPTPTPVPTSTPAPTPSPTATPAPTPAPTSAPATGGDGGGAFMPGWLVLLWMLASVAAARARRAARAAR
jgi:lysyl endopeptidase